MSSDLPKYTSAELSVSKIDELVSKKMTFQVVGLSDISRIVEAVEGCIEKKGMSCRVYTEYRSAALIGETFMGGFGILAGISIALHNVATFNPDYEIGKNKIKGSVTVTYKKVV
jgi:hypothetical protein